jgi:hypothetical protein
MAQKWTFFGTSIAVFRRKGLNCTYCIECERGLSASFDGAVTIGPQIICPWSVWPVLCIPVIEHNLFFSHLVHIFHGWSVPMFFRSCAMDVMTLHGSLRTWIHCPDIFRDESFNLKKNGRYKDKESVLFYMM